jgi:PAS domain S-box-containing protein
MLTLASPATTRDAGLPEILWEDHDLAYGRVRRYDDTGVPRDCLAVTALGEPPSPDTIDRFAHEYELREHLDSSWALLPLALERKHDQTMLLLTLPAGQPLHHRIGQAMDVGEFLQLAIAISRTIRRLHDSGLVHKNLKPSHLLFDGTAGIVRLTGFGIASKLSREQPPVAPSEIIAGTLPYMAPEQTGRMNRTVDSRADLYSLGVTLYQLLTGRLPFQATEPMEWVHCHVARVAPAPHEIRDDVPIPISGLIMKLLAKMPEQRYQTASGIESDLARCLADLRGTGRVAVFELGQHDIFQRLLIPDRLYARTTELSELLATFTRVATSGAPELVLISGYAGIGKSALVNELQKMVVLAGGRFAAGKFEQYKRDIPYATIAQAFQDLVRPLLTMAEQELTGWRDRLTAAVGPNGQLMVDLIPQLALVIGEQPPPPRVDPHFAKARFHLVFQRLLGVFAREEHPLTLFIDDLQWLDVATLDLMKHLVTAPAIRHLLVIGAYRDNEIDASHPLSGMLQDIRRETVISEISLGPLGVEQVAQLAADTLRTDIDNVRQLAQLILQKTGGNPFFTIQFIRELAEEHLLAFDPDTFGWQWDMDRIRSKDISDNIADLMTAKLNRLSKATRDVLGQIACLGNAVDRATLIAIGAGSATGMDAALQDAVDSGLLLRTETSFSLIHDRVHEAAYAMIPPHNRALLHLATARALLSETAHAQLADQVFEIVDQFNRGLTAIDTPAERVRVAELNLIAGKRARNASAYASAQRYIDVGRQLLPDDSWRSDYRLTFDLERYHAECSFVSGNLAATEQYLAALKRRATTIVDETDIVCLQLLVYFTAGKHEAALELGLNFLQRIGNPLPLHASDADVQREYDQMQANLAKVRIEDVLDLPAMVAADPLATMVVLTELYPAASTAPNRSRGLTDLIVLRMTNLSLQHGNCDASSVAYAGLSLFLGPRFDDYLTAIRFGELACELADRIGTDRSKARAYAQSGSFAMPWYRSFADCRSILALAFTTGKSTGDVAFAAYTLRNLLTNQLVSGLPLDQLQHQAEDALAFTRVAGFGPVAHHFIGHRWLAAMLRGIELDDHPADDGWARQNVAGQRGVAQMASYYWVFRLQERFLAADYPAAMAAAAFIKPIRWAMHAGLELFIYEHYAALAHAAMCDQTGLRLHEEHVTAVREHAQRLSAWCDNCPENFADATSLVLAELARIEGRFIDAEHLYEHSIHLAVEQGSLQNEGLSCELAARFYHMRGMERLAIVYAQSARSCYLRWGAASKVSHLERLYPRLLSDSPMPSLASSISTPIEQLDLATVIKISQAVSSEIVLEDLITTLMRLAVEHAGAQRGLLILSHGDAYRIEAEALTLPGDIKVALRQADISDHELPQTVFHYAARTNESVLLHDASADEQFRLDGYIVRHQARSVLCMSLLKQSRMVGVLYLENNLAAHVFTPSRIAILKLLASAAVISLENTRLYAELREREAKVRRLVDSNIIGIFIWDADERITEANDAFMRIIGYERDDFLSRAIKWRDLTPIEWHAADDARLPALIETGVVAPFEKEFIRKNGARVPVLIGAALLDQAANQCVAYVLDLTDRNNAEQSARESERRYHELQLQLVHANRVATLGQLSASIAHELNQPLTGIMTNAGTCIAMLASAPPNIAGAAETAKRTIRDAKRASDVMTRLRSLFANNAALTEALDLSEVAQEVLDLCAHEFRRGGVTVRPVLHAANVMGDRIQLQQVIVNLLQNAIDAMSSVHDRPRDMVIEVAQNAQNDVVLSVSDTGTGFEPGVAEKLFDAFYTTKDSGMGIGLSVSRSIVERHAGRIWASCNSGPGATFSFSIQGHPQHAAG